MGCHNSKEVRVNSGRPMTLSENELLSRAARRSQNRSALLRFLKETHPELASLIVSSESEQLALLPTISLAVSGGGWRAMMAHTAALDGLSEAGILDAVEAVAGLSGGSWMVAEYALSGVDSNVMHGTKGPNPWAFGNQFNSDVHRYEGLIHILSKKVVQRAAKITGSVEVALGKFAKLITNTDLTFFGILFFSKGGSTMVGRYASFLEDQLLSWLTIDQRKHAILEEEFTKAAILSGKLPMLVMSAVDNVKNVEETAPAQRNSQVKPFDVWCEFTPFGARHPLFNGGRACPIQQLEATIDKKPQQLTVAKLAGICGSAFAVDKAQAAEKIPFLRFAKLFGFDASPTKMLLKDATTTVHKQSTAFLADAEYFGSLRDAGLDINIPFPAVFYETSGREYDILLAFDGGEDASGAGELANAVARGYAEVTTHDLGSLDSAFPAGDRVRVFVPPPSHPHQPIIIYVLLLNRTRTSRVSYDRDEILTCTAFVRETIRGQVVPELFAAIRNWIVDRLPNDTGITVEEKARLRAMDAVNFPHTRGGHATQQFEASEAMVSFAKVTAIALQSLLEENPGDAAMLVNTPLDVVQAVERQLLSKIANTELHPGALSRLAELAAQADSDDKSSFSINQESLIDAALVRAGWLKESLLVTGEYEFLNSLLWDYQLAVNAAAEILRTTPKGLEMFRSITKRSASLLPALPVASDTHQHLRLKPEWRFVYSYLAMMFSTPQGKPLQPLLEKRVQQESVSLLEGIMPQGADTPFPLTTEAFLRFDSRDTFRRSHGIQVAVETLSFMLEGSDDSAVSSILSTWKPFLKNERFAYIVLEAVCFAARGVRGRTVVQGLLPTVQEFLLGKKKHFFSFRKRSVSFHDSLLLGKALYAAAYGNAGIIEQLKDAGIPGNADDPAHFVTLDDACKIGNHNAVEAILHAVIDGPPPASALRIALQKNFPKVAYALVADEEADINSLREAERIFLEAGYRNGSGGDAEEAWSLLKQRLGLSV